MPTMLPSRRAAFLRRYKPERETLRNIGATAAECVVALIFVAALVMILCMMPAPPAGAATVAPSASETVRVHPAHALRSDPYLPLYAP